MTLAAYEARFGVRRVAALHVPDRAYGLVPTRQRSIRRSNPITTPLHAPPARRCSWARTAPTRSTIDAGWAYPAHAADAPTIPLLVDDAGNVYAATTHVLRRARGAGADVRAGDLRLPHARSSRTAWSDWATRGVFVGERHVYLSAQIDDLFLASDDLPGAATYRMTSDDMQAFADWQTARRADPLTADLRLAWAANVQGSQRPRAIR